MKKDQQQLGTLEDLKFEIGAWDYLQTWTDDQCIRLFHYTTNESKEKIVNADSITFKFSNANDFLDKNEGIHIMEPFYHACGTMYERGEIDGSFYAMLKNIQAKDIVENVETAWILCFSRDGCSQFLKERYAPKDGWVLALNNLHQFALLYQGQ